MKPPAPSAPSLAPSAEELAGALHDVSNSLTAVLGWLEAARRDCPAGPAAAAIDVALSQARAGHAAARRALGAEAGDAGAARSARSVAESAAVAVAQEAARAGVRIRVEGGTTDRLVASAPLVEQVLTNLLLNAVAFSPAGSDVRLSLDRGDGAVRFRVEDEGPGIPAELRATLFEGGRSTRPGGAGHGLRHARAVARSLGGELELAGTGPGGTAMRLTWPEAEAPSGTHRRVPSRAIGGLRVLVLEDDPAVEALVDLGLSARGAVVTSVGSLGALRRELGRGDHDALVADLSPLGADPGGALAAVHREHPGLALVVTSGRAVGLPGASPPVAWVRKPYELCELVDALASTAARR